MLSTITSVVKDTIYYFCRASVAVRMHVVHKTKQDEVCGKWRAPRCSCPHSRNGTHRRQAGSVRLSPAPRSLAAHVGGYRQAPGKVTFSKCMFVLHCIYRSSGINGIPPTGRSTKPLWGSQNIYGVALQQHDLQTPNHVHNLELVRITTNELRCPTDYSVANLC